jgi:hypothetical protein
MPQPLAYDLEWISAMTPIGIRERLDLDANVFLTHFPCCLEWASVLVIVRNIPFLEVWPSCLAEKRNGVVCVGFAQTKTSDERSFHDQEQSLPSYDTSCSLPFMNAQGCVARECEEVFTENDILSPRQQIRLHFYCLVREHKFSTLGWHLRGIRRALFLSDSAARNAL